MLYPAAVQGENTAKTVIEGIRVFNEEHPVDVIIIARGGGSFEDLFGFNDETLARSIFASKIPIISAVGHETDFTICDFVSDLRAPTPSAAAELVYPMSLEIQNRIEGAKTRLNLAIQNLVKNKKNYLSNLTVDRLKKSPNEIITRNRLLIDNLVLNMQNKIENKVVNSKAKYTKNVALLDSLSPLKTLSRGYTVTTNKEGKMLRSKEDVSIGDTVDIKVIDGSLKANVVDIL